MVDISENFGKRLKEIRVMRKMTQSELYEKTGIEINSISRIENGKHFPKKENIEAFSKVLSVEPEEFFKYKHLKTKKELISEINNILKSAKIKDIQFISKIIFSYFE